MKTGSATGLQIAFLIFAVALLAVPLSNAVSQTFGLGNSDGAVLGRTIPFILALLIIFCVPGLRKQALGELARPILQGRRFELAAVALAKVPLGFAAIGAVALWTWLTQGGYALEQKMAYSESEQLAQAFSPQGMFVSLFLATLVAPLVEELVFRGFLYRAWERRWGWFPSALLVSTVFGLYHPVFWSAFVSSLVFVSVLRRTGSLRGPIIVHAFFNAMLWYPFAGQFAKPPENAALGDIGAWGFQLGCLLVLAIALAFYFLLAAREDVRHRMEGFG
jgi:membrane protease YdiL (CAAX protease family)